MPIRKYNPTSPGRRLMSVFQLGIRWLRDRIINGDAGDCPCQQLYLYPS